VIKLGEKYRGIKKEEGEEKEGNPWPGGHWGTASSERQTQTPKVFSEFRTKDSVRHAAVQGG